MTAAQKLTKILADPILWLQTFCLIVNKNGKKVPFKLNPEQRELTENLDKYNIVLKSRQLGITSVSCGLSLFYAITQPNTTCLLISYSMDSAALIFDKLKQLYDDLPRAIKLKDIANNRTMLKFENGSKISVCTMGSKEIARGSSIKFCHISEVAFCKQEMVNKQILAIEQALLPDGKIILESTANGLNEFSNIWSKAENRDNLYKPFFFSWIDDKIMFADEYRQFAERYFSIHGETLSFDDLAPDERVYYDMGATLEQLTWRRIKIKNSSEEQFKQEFPATPIEAFITTGSNMFDTQKIVNQYNIAKNIKPLKGISSLPTELKPYSGSYLSIWEIPDRSKKYYIGVDASEGIGYDFNVITIFDQDLMQVAEFRSNKTPPHEVAKITYNLALWYNNALCVIEKASGGHIILDRLKNIYRYHNLYKHKDYDQRGRIIKKVGFNTNPKTKPIMINDFVELWDNDSIYIKSLNLLNEMKVFEYTDGKMGAEVGKHDDTVIAAALAIQGIKSGVRYL
jgi:hypothetical protein